MSTDRYTYKMMADGKTELERALKYLAARGITALPVARTGRDAAYHPDNLAALVVRRNGRGWTADVVFENVPFDMPDVVGSPEAFPLPNREIALAAGHRILAMILTTSYSCTA